MESKPFTQQLSTFKKWNLNSHGSLLGGLLSIFLNWIIWVPVLGFTIGLMSVCSKKPEEIENRNVAALGLFLNAIFFLVGLKANGHLH